MRLTTPEQVKKFVKERTGVTLSDFHAEDLLGRIETYLVSQGSLLKEETGTPYDIPADSRNLSRQGRDWLSNYDPKTRKRVFTIYAVSEDWVGRKLTKISKNIDPDRDNHDSFLFLRRRMVQRALTGDADSQLVEAFSLSEGVRPREIYPIQESTKTIARLVSERKKYRVRIPKAAHIREETPFQLLHMPDDEGCHSILMEEAHGMKTFFRGNHGDRGDRGEVSFWWSDEEDLWIFWTDWVRWVIKFKRKP